MSLLPTCLLAAMACAVGANPATLVLTEYKNQKFYSAGLGESKIVGGSETTIDSHPYMVSVEMYFSWMPKWFHKCGGTIIDHWNILSAAHCIQDNPTASQYRVRAGSTVRGSGGVVVQVAKVFYHPKFNPTAIDYDVGIYRLKKSLKYTSVIKPITLPKIGANLAAKTKVEVIGWGAEQTMALEYPHELRETKVAIVPWATCFKDYKGTRVLSSRMICASGHNKDSCSGDSGGPLLNIKHGADDVQYGLVSWGDNCADAQHPGVYTSLTDKTIRDYIAQTLKAK